LREDDGWDGADVDFLADLPQLRCVRIRHRSIRDASGIHAQPALRELEVHTRCRTPIDASAFPALERCALQWRPRARSVLSAARLIELEVTHFAGTDLRAFGSLRSLETLTLERGVLAKLDGIEALTSLRVLRLRGLRRLRSLDGVERLPALAELDVAECPAVSEEAARR